MNAPTLHAIPETGIVHGLSNAAYHAHPSLSKSQLADFLACPAKYYGLHVDPDRRHRAAETSGQRSGTLLHTLVLEPDTFNDRYAIGPNVSRNTKEWRAWESTLRPGVTALKADEFEEGRLQAESLRRHEEVAELLSSGIAEASIFWTDEETGIQCRCRPDWLHETPHGWIVLDLKTGPVQPWAFGSQIARMTYDVQEAFYTEGVEKATGNPVLAFLFGVVETTEPFISMCGVIDDVGRESGKIKTRDALRSFAKCRENNEWPGFSGVQVIRLPAWSLAEQE